MYDILKTMAITFESEENPFGLQIQPGVGTFENFFEMGSWNGASADGRRLGTTIASDLSAAPCPSDLPINYQYSGFKESLAGFKRRGTELMTSGAPTDYNIREDFLPEKLVEVLREFARRHSLNVLTVTVANLETLSAAVNRSEQYNLLSIRTGG